MEGGGGGRRWVGEPALGDEGPWFGVDFWRVVD
jgi:hypothetical protein